VDANYKVNLQIMAKDMASSVVEGIAGKLGGLLKAGLALGAVALPVIAVGKALSECVKLAGEEEVGVTRLNAALKASFEGNAAAAEKAARGASAAHTVMVAAMKPDKLAAVGTEIQKVTARINDQSAALARSKKPTESAALALQLNQQKLAGLQAKFAAGSQLTAKSVGGVTAAVSKLPGTWEDASNAIEEYLASSLKRTALDDGEGRVAVQRLIEATGDYRKSLGLMGITQDLAAAKGMDLASAAQLVGKVAQGNVSVLTRYGIVLGKGATATEGLAAMQKRFGGQAEAYAKTYEGSQKKLGIAIGNIKETIGAKLLPLLATAATGMADWLIDALPVIEAGAEKFGKAIEPITEWVKILFENLSDNRGILYSVGSGLEYLATSLLGVKGAGFGTAFGDFFTKQLPEVAKQLPLFRGMFENMLLGTRVNWQPLANALEALGASPEVAAKAAGVATTITTYVQDAFDKVKLSYKEGGVGGVIEMMRLEALKAWPSLLGAFDTLRANLQEKLSALWGGRQTYDPTQGMIHIGGIRDELAKLGIPESVLTSFETFVSTLQTTTQKVGEAAKLLAGGEFRKAMEALGVPESSIVAMERVGVALGGIPGVVDAIIQKAPEIIKALGDIFALFAGQTVANIEAISTSFTGINTSMGTIAKIVTEDFIPAFEDLNTKLAPAGGTLADIHASLNGIIGSSPAIQGAITGIGDVLIKVKDYALFPMLIPLKLLNEALSTLIALYGQLKAASEAGKAAIAGVPSLPMIDKPDTPFAEGGDFVANRAMRILVGERGPERVTVTPLDQGRAETSAPGVTLNMYNYDPDASELARRGTWKALAAIGAA